MLIKRSASAHWTGNVKEGKGSLTTQSGVLSNTQYGFQSRFADGIGTNPEELIGAAHAGCFSMKLSANITAENITPESIDTKATVIFQDGAITEVQLDTKVKAAGLSQEKFNDLVANAEKECPISKLLKAKISVTSSLIA